MSSSEIQIQNHCRTCMRKKDKTVRKKSSTFISICEHQEIDDYGYISIIELIQKTFPQLSITVDDKLPKDICNLCLKMLNDIHKFQNNALKVDQQLRQIIRELPQTPLETTCDPLSIISADFLDGKSDSHRRSKRSKILPSTLFTNCKETKEEYDSHKDVKQEQKAKPDSNTEEIHSACNDGKIMNGTNIIPQGKSEKVHQDELSKNDDVGGKHKMNSLKSENVDQAGLSNNNDFDWELGMNNLKSENVDQAGLSNNNDFDWELGMNSLKSENVDQAGLSNNNDFDWELGMNSLKSENVDQAGLSNNNDSDWELGMNSLKSENFDKAGFSNNDDSDWEPEMNSLKRKTNIKSDAENHCNKKDTSVPATKNKTKCDAENDCNKKDTSVPATKNKTNQVLNTLKTRECGRTLKKRVKLNRHVKRKQEQTNGVKAHICPHCGLSLKTRRTLRTHLQLHDESKPLHKCKYCDKVFTRTLNLRNHEKLHTGDLPYLCSVCGKSFAEQRTLNMHYERHNTELKYECPECPKRFRCAGSIYSHRAIVHSNARPHVCDICGAGFKKPYSMRKHRINHGEKTHKCDYCDMKFVRTDQCRRHMRTHTGEKPYKCKYCERAYTQSNEMIKHMRVHLGDNVYRCEMCPQGFRLLCELRKHFSTHKEDNEQTKLKNLQALREEEEKIQAKLKADLAKDLK